MIEPAHYESRNVESMRNFLLRLPSTMHEPKLFYDARFAEVRGQQGGDRVKDKATWLAELIVQHHGSAYENYQSVTDAKPHKVLMYVQARHINQDFLVVGHELDEDKTIVHPARLSLQDLIGYREVERVE